MVREQILLEAVSRHVKEGKGFGRRHFQFTKSKSSLINLIAFYDEMTDCVDNGRAVNDIFLDF